MNALQQTLQAALEQAVREAKAPGAVALVGQGDAVLFEGAAGFRQITPTRQAATLDTFYDLASLTKVIATTTVVLQLVEEGKLALDAPLPPVVPLGWGPQVTLKQILTHTAGLPPLLAGLKESATSLAQGVGLISGVALRSAPGTRRVYSDLGFITLAQVVELIEQDTFDMVCARRIFEPLGLKQMGFRPPDAWRANCAATEDCPWRKKVVVGEVHDENAWAMGGVSGHAGLFATVGDVGKFCAALLRGEVLPDYVLEEAARQDHVPFYPWQGLGWKTDPWAGSIEGHLGSRLAIGHTGWTGTNLWIDRSTGIYAVLLGNTCHPSRDARDNRTLRRVFHQAVNAALYPVRTNTHTGIDRVLWNDFEDLENKRTALLTHLAAPDQRGRDALAVLGLREGLAPRRVFTPEHGLRGAAEAGEMVRGERAPVEVISLYGEQKAPTAAQLADIDLLVVNLQDIGARYYTYVGTMKACLEACAAAGTPVLVLDRPNPLGGVVLEGPMPERVGNLVCSVRTPIRHGMTMGEMALFLQQTEPALRRLKVNVLPLDGWSRARHWDDLDMVWTPPSPNMPDWETALLYVGTCLFEGVNVNEGRGTETPFRCFGAPWLDPARVMAAVDPACMLGATLTPLNYTPRAIPGKAAKPVYMDTACHGIAIKVADRNTLRPFALACGLLRALHTVHGGVLEWKSNFDVLAGGPALRTALTGDRSLAEYLATVQAGLAAFDRERPRLYA